MFDRIGFHDWKDVAAFATVTATFILGALIGVKVELLRQRSKKKKDTTIDIQ